MNKIISIHQPSYLPWLGYFHKMAVSDTFVILDHVQLEKGSFTNRNKILQPDGREMWLTIPVLTKENSKQPINQVLINDKVTWCRKHSHSIRVNYSRTPYWSAAEYGHAVREMFRLLDSFDWKDLATILIFSSIYLSRMLGLDVNTKNSSDYDPPLAKTKSDLVLEICLREGADIYFSGALGKGYLEENKFKKAGIKIIYQSYNSSAYEQHQLKQREGFHDKMSIIDLLLNCGKESLDILMQGNVTREEL